MMIGRSLRVLFGYVLACLAAGLTVVLFVYSPTELATSLGSDRTAEAGLLALAAATHTSIFAAPLALLGLGFGEWRRIRSLFYYVLVGLLIAAAGFLSQYWTEAGGQGSIVNNYAAMAFLATGLAAGIVYWLFAGRRAGGRRRFGDDEILSPVRPAPTSPARPAN